MCEQALPFDKAGDDDDDDGMNAFTALRPGLAIVALLAGAAAAHEGHGATPAHVHVGGGFPVDVGAAVVIAVIAIAAVVNVARARRP